MVQTFVFFADGPTTEKNKNCKCLNGQDNDVASGHAAAQLTSCTVRVPGAAACVGVVSPQNLARK